MSSLGSFGGLFRRGGGRNSLAGIGGVRPKFDWSSFLSNTQKTLNVVNQAIPIFYQIKPIWSNAKTMFRIMGAIKDDEDENTNVKFHPNNQSKNDHDKTEEETSNISNVNTLENQPRFFL